MDSTTRSFQQSPRRTNWEDLLKSLRRTIPLATVTFTLALGASPALAQNFYSLQLTNSPPLPFLPFDVPVYSLGDRTYGYDDRAVDYQSLWAEAELLNALEQELGLGGPVYSMSGNPGACGDLTIPMVTVGSEVVVTLTLTNLDADVPADVFMADALVGNAASDAHWRWVARGTNGQSFTFTNGICAQAYYVLGCTNDTDGDGLTDAYEILVTKTSPTNSYSVNALFTDAQMENILVNDPRQDCANEQNTQFESTCAVLGTNVIVAWVDSNLGVYGLGQDARLTNYTPRLVGYAISRDGGVTFEDKGAPPLSRAGSPANDDGDGGDPVLAVDTASEVVYLAGTSPRNAGWAGIPLWKSANAGVNFDSPVIVLPDTYITDKPWITVDNHAGTGQHDVYLTCTVNTSPFRILLTAAMDGNINSWTEPVIIREANTTIQCGIPVIGPNHVAYVFWYERDGATNWLKMRQVLDRGTTLGEIRTVCQLTTTNSGTGSLDLKRSNTADASDTFKALPFPVPAANPIRTNHLYMAYADSGENPGDKADIFFVASTNGGANWTSPGRVNTVWTNDQWMPVLAVKPDGTQLFMAWYDRRQDTNNSLIDFYGCFGVIATNGSVSFTNEFKITTASFPPVFAGRSAENMIEGHYDPVYPPEFVNLHWWYPDWPLVDEIGQPVLTSPTYISHVGEYDGAWAEVSHVLLSWTDNRRVTAGAGGQKNNRDIRFLKLQWP